MPNLLGNGPSTYDFPNGPLFRGDSSGPNRHFIKDNSNSGVNTDVEDFIQELNFSS